MKRLRESSIGSILDRLPVLISYTDVEGRFQYANAALLMACGKPLDRLAGLPAREVLGEAVFTKLTFVPDKDAEGQVRGYIGIGYDVTARVERETFVASREQQLTSILHTMAEGMVIHDRDGRMIEANPAAEELLMLTRRQLLDWDMGQPHWQCIFEDGTALAVEELPVFRALRTGRPVRGQIIGVCIIGQPVRWISVNAQPLYNGKDPTPSGVVGTFVDVTAVRASMERIRELVQRVESVREQERRELALVLHEGLAQDLFSMQLVLRDLLREATRAQVPALEDLSRVLDRCLADTRQVASSLRPTGLADRPISQVIAEHAQYFEGLSKLRILVHDESRVAISDESLRLLLFRAAQEAIANVARHAKATGVDIHLSATGTGIELRVADDGIGMEPGSMDKTGSLGLLGIRERARSVGGTLRMERNAIGGTTLILTLPLDRAAPALAPGGSNP